jgi:hypothetical protein
VDSFRNKGGRRTDRPQNCHKKKNGNGHNTLPTTTAILAEAGTLKFAESFLDLISDYIRLKTKELGAIGKS